MTNTLDKVKHQAKLLQRLASALAIAVDLKTAYGISGAMENHLEIVDDLLSQEPMESLGFVNDIRPNETPEELQVLGDKGWEKAHLEWCLER